MFRFRMWVILTMLVSGQLHASIPAKRHVYGCEKPLHAALFESGLLYSDKTGTGSSQDLLELLATESSCEIQISAKPRARIWYELENGSTDLTINGLISEERKKFGEFAPYMNAKSLVIIKKELSDVHSFGDFARLKTAYVSAVRSYKYGPDIDHFLDQMRKEGRVKEYKDDTALTRAFADGATSMIFLQGLTHEQILKENALEDKVRILNIDHGLVTGSFVFAKKNFTAQQLQAWQELVLKVRKNGQIKQIFKKFFGEKASQQFLLKN
jgi:ABC-type amino acid transport substrate-binding protein